MHLDFLTKRTIFIEMTDNRFTRRQNFMVRKFGRVGHGWNMPLLTELGNIFWAGFYKDAAPDGAGENNLDDLYEITLVTRQMILQAFCQFRGTSVKP